MGLRSLARLGHKLFANIKSVGRKFICDGIEIIGKPAQIICE